MNWNIISPAVLQERPTVISRRRKLITGAAIAAAFSLGGCAANAGTSSGQVESGANPYDTYLAEEMDTIISSQETLRVQCIADNGFREFTPHATEETKPVWRRQINQLSVEVAFFGSEPDAAARGLRLPPDGPSREKHIRQDASLDAVSTACDKSAWAALGKDAFQTYLEYSRLGNILGEVFLSDELLPLQDKVVQCLIDAGEPVVKAPGQLFAMTAKIPLGTPVQYPEPGSDPATGSKQVSAARETIAYVPTPAESELAVGYYRCSRDRGARDEFGALIRDAQIRMVAEHETELIELNPKIQQAARKAAELSGR